MPDEPRMSKLTEAQQRQVITWLAEGLRSAEISEKIKAEFDVEITRQGVDYYRKAHAEEIAAAYADAFETAAAQGLCNRIARLGVLERNAKRMIDDTRAGGRGFTTVNKELRETLRDIRDELGDLKLRSEHSGPDGGPIQQEIGWFDAVKKWEAEDAEDADSEAAKDGQGGASDE